MKPYSLEADHKAIKEQVKKWELAIDALLASDDVMISSEAGEALEAMSHEMMSINL